MGDLEEMLAFALGDQYSVTSDFDKESLREQAGGYHKAKLMGVKMSRWKPIFAGLIIYIAGICSAYFLPRLLGEKDGNISDDQAIERMIEKEMNSQLNQKKLDYLFELSTRPRDTAVHVR